MSVHLSGRSSVPVIYQSTEHCHRLDKMLDGVMQGAISVAEDLQETGGEKYSSHVDAIGSKMEGFVQLAHEAELVKLALRQLEGSITAHDPDEPPPDLASVFEERLEELRESAEFDAKAHPRVAEYYQRLREGSDEEEEEMDTQEDEDLVMGQVKKSLYCPITKTLLEDPVTNQQCKHSYSRAAILQHIRKRNNPKCPVCNVPIKESMLKKDEKLQRLVRKEKRQKDKGQRSNKQRVVQL